MKLKDIILSEVSQMKKDKYCMSSLICGILKKKKKLIELTETEKNSDCQELRECKKWTYVCERVQTFIYNIGKF